ncbi:MAG: hypothetical protein ACM3NH_02340 [Candidatus Saccharibacteria bacterium]
METERQQFSGAESELSSLKAMLNEVLYRANMAMHEEKDDEAEKLLGEGERIRMRIRELDPSYIQEEADRLNRELHEQNQRNN